MSLIISKNKHFNKQHPHLAVRDLSGNNLGYLFHHEKEESGGVLDVQLTDDACFQHIPNLNTERNILYVCGQSGSGKSYYIKKYAEEYKKIFPKMKFIYSVLNVTMRRLIVLKQYRE
jgi:hypothetical protein